MIWQIQTQRCLPWCPLDKEHYVSPLPHFFWNRSLYFLIYCYHLSNYSKLQISQNMSLTLCGDINSENILKDTIIKYITCASYITVNPVKQNSQTCIT